MPSLPRVWAPGYLQTAGLSEQSCRRWHKVYGGPKIAGTKRVKALERENAADRGIEIHIQGIVVFLYL
jgi:hypothetical protein